MKHHISTLLLAIAFSTSSYAQNEANPWKITVGTNAIEVDPVGSSSKDTETQISPNFSYLEISRYLGGGFSLDLAGSLNNLERTSGAEDLYYGIDLGTSLSANQIIDLGKFEPTLRLGVGLSGGLSGFSPLGDDFFNIYGGLGLNYWFNDAVALTLRSTVKSYVKEFDKWIANGDGGLGHLQHVAGLSFSFDKGNDSDKDGVNDDEDACPDVPGLESLNGCPDDDGDNIRNGDDDCPRIAGLAALKGCPDSDRDGVKDDDDVCPNIPGAMLLNGCPDMDKDGIADHDDQCPDKAGSEANDGCPESVENEAPPTNKALIEPQHPLSALAHYSINFNFDKHKKIALEDDRIIALVIDVLKNNPDARISIDGHTDSIGKKSYNQALSQKRATYVKDYLVKAGIEPTRMEVNAFGESMPIAGNTSEEGRTANRRVAFRVLD